MLEEPENQFSLTCGALSTVGPAKKQFPITDHQQRSNHKTVQQPERRRHATAGLQHRDQLQDRRTRHVPSGCGHRPFSTEMTRYNVKIATDEKPRPTTRGIAIFLLIWLCLLGARKTEAATTIAPSEAVNGP